MNDTDLIRDDPRFGFLSAVMVDPALCGYCEGTGWVFLDKSYNGYPYGRGPYIEPDDTNGGYEACGRCNSDHEVEFGSGEKVKPWRRWTDEQIIEIVAALREAEGYVLYEFGPDGVQTTFKAGSAAASEGTA